MPEIKHERYQGLYRMITETFEKVFFEKCSQYLSGRLIDIGCGVKPYENALKNNVTEHIGVDHIETSHDKLNIDLFGTAYNIPADAESFDCAICTAVLEHLEEPGDAIKECYRVLKKGANAIYSVPLMYPVHEPPRDFYRYTKYGLKYLFEKAGFEILEIVPLSGFALTFLQLHLIPVNGKFNKGIIKKSGIIELYIYLITKLGMFLNKHDNSKEFTWMYVVVVKK